MGWKNRTIFSPPTLSETFESQSQNVQGLWTLKKEAKLEVCVTTSIPSLLQSIFPMESVAQLEVTTVEAQYLAPSIQSIY